ncbi:MAG: ABC transporter permease [Gemmatimonadales bacterium]
MSDFRLALRGLVRSPGLTLLIVLSLALGIGANTTVFTWMDTLVFRPLPVVPQPDRLVVLEARAPGGGGWSLSYPAWRDWNAAQRSFEGIAGFKFSQLSLRDEGDPQAQRVWGLAVTGNYFDVLQVRPMLGRTFLPDEEAASALVAVISHGLWQRKFHGDSGVIGHQVMVNGSAVTIVGVVPPRFGGTTVGLGFDMWLPVTLLNGAGIERRGNHWLDAFARLKPGVTLGQARADLDAVAGRLAREHPDSDPHGSVVTPFSEDGAPSWFRPIFAALLGITALVLLIACANVANLLLARAIARQREIGVRVALGASRWRIIRQLLTESAVLAVLAGGAGILVAFVSRNLLLAFIPATPFPVALDIQLNPRILAFAVLVSVLTAVVFGLVPALRASRPDLIPTLKDELGSGIGARSRLRSTLVAGQIALSVIALVAAGLFVRSLRNAQAVDPGFRDPAHLLLISTDLTLAGYESQAPAQEVLDRLLAKIRAVPGVAEASYASAIPLGFGGSSSSRLEVEGYQPAADENMSIENNRVGPGFFPAMGVPLLEGRGILETDRSDAARIAVVNQAFAERYWPGEDPIGRRFNAGGDVWYTVVGIAQTGKYHKLSESPEPYVYFPNAMRFRYDLDFLVRTSSAPEALVAPLRRAFAEVDPNIPFLDPRTMEDHIGAAVFIQRIGAWLLAGFGTLALLLSAIGIYAVVWFGVSRRTREIGVRVALGASRRDVLGLIVGQSMRVAAIGMALGIVGALGVGRLLQSQLFGVNPRDPLTFSAIALVLSVVAIVASWLPARKAAGVDPVVALKSE